MTQKQDLRERCSYLLILFKAKDKALFEKYTAELSKISAEASSDFYHYLLAEYKKLVEGPSFSQAPAPKAPAPQAQAAAPAKKAKKAAKKVTKKAAKKVVKKVAKKAVKKTAKKTKKR